MSPWVNEWISRGCWKLCQKSSDGSSFIVSDINSPGLTDWDNKSSFTSLDLGASVIHPIANQWPCCCSGSKQRELDLSQTCVELLFHRDLIAFLWIDWSGLETVGTAKWLERCRWNTAEESWSRVSTFYCWTGLFSVFQRSPVLFLLYI